MDHGSRPRIQSDPIPPSFVSTHYDPPGSGRRLTSPFLPRDLEIPLVIVKIGEHPVGFGVYSDVWRAKMTRDSGVISLVALKVLRPVGSDTDRLRKRLEREVRCWKVLDHKNIAPFYGVDYQSNGSPGIVLPWYENGSADVYLRQHPNFDPMKIILEIAAGIEHLHDKGVVHGDLKGGNVLIDDDGHAKLIDFGLSRLIDSEDDLTTSTASSIRWCAPELLSAQGTRTTKSSDVYAFASTALELLTGGVPYVRLPSKMAVYPIVITGVNPRELSNDLRSDIPRPEFLWRVLEQC